MYGKVNPRGTTERYGLVQVRLDLFLEDGDVRYDDPQFYQIDETSKAALKGYPGKLDEEGSPIDLEAYAKWEASLPRIWLPERCFHHHFIYLDPYTLKDEQITSAMSLHLPNFYKAWTEEWDKVQGGMRHGWDVAARRPRPTRYNLIQPERYDARKAECLSKVDILKVSSFATQVSKIGEIFPATEIDVGNAAVNGSSYSELSNGSSGYYTRVNKGNPSNGSGAIDYVEAWFYDIDTGHTVTVYVGTFSEGDTNVLTCRDGGLLGDISVEGSKLTFSGLDIEIATGDYFGADSRDNYRCRLEKTTSGDGIWTANGQYCDASDSATFSLATSCCLSLYGTGETAGAIPYVEGFASSVSLSVGSPQRLLERLRECDSSIQLDSDFSRLVQKQSVKDTITSLTANRQRKITKVSSFTSSHRLTSVVQTYRGLLQVLSASLSLLVHIDEPHKMFVRGESLQVLLDVFVSRVTVISKAFSSSLSLVSLVARVHERLRDLVSSLKLAIPSGGSTYIGTGTSTVSLTPKISAPILAAKRVARAFVSLSSSVIRTASFARVVESSLLLASLVLVKRGISKVRKTVVSLTSSVSREITTSRSLLSLEVLSSSVDRLSKIRRSLSDSIGLHVGSITSGIAHELSVALSLTSKRLSTSAFARALSSSVELSSGFIDRVISKLKPCSASLVLASGSILRGISKTKDAILGLNVDKLTGWTSPTGHVCDEAVWSTETNAYDGSLSSYAYTGEVGSYLELTFPAVLSSKIRIYGYDKEDMGTENPFTPSIDVYYDSDWHNIFSSGALPKKVWNVIEIGSSQTVSAVRITPLAIDNMWFRLCEVEVEFQSETNLPNPARLVSFTREHLTALSFLVRITRAGLKDYIESLSASLSLVASTARMFAAERLHSTQETLTSSIRRSKAFERAASVALSLISVIRRGISKSFNSSETLVSSIRRQINTTRLIETYASLSGSLKTLLGINRVEVAIISLSVSVQRAFQSIRNVISSVVLTPLRMFVTLHMRAFASSLSLEVLNVKRTSFARVHSNSVVVLSVISRTYSAAREWSASLVLNAIKHLSISTTLGSVVELLALKSRSVGVSRRLSSIISLRVLLNRTLVTIRSNSAVVLLASSVSRIRGSIEEFISQVVLNSSVSRLLGILREKETQVLLVASVKKGLGRLKVAVVSLTSSIRRNTGISRSEESIISLTGSVQRAFHALREVIVEIIVTPVREALIPTWQILTTSVQLNASRSRVVSVLREATSTLQLSASVLKSRWRGLVENTVLGLRAILGRQAGFNSTSSSYISLVSSVARRIEVIRTETMQTLLAATLSNRVSLVRELASEIAILSSLGIVGGFARLFLTASSLVPIFRRVFSKQVLHELSVELLAELDRRLTKIELLEAELHLTPRISRGLSRTIQSVVDLVSFMSKNISMTRAHQGLISVRSSLSKSRDLFRSFVSVLQITPQISRAISVQRLKQSIVSLSVSITRLTGRGYLFLTSITLRSTLAKTRGLQRTLESVLVLRNHLQKVRSYLHEFVVALRLSSSFFRERGVFRLLSTSLRERATMSKSISFLRSFSLDLDLLSSIKRIFHRVGYRTLAFVRSSYSTVISSRGYALKINTALTSLSISSRGFFLRIRHLSSRIKTFTLRGRQ